MHGFGNKGDLADKGMLKVSNMLKVSYENKRSKPGFADIEPISSQCHPATPSKNLRNQKLSLDFMADKSIPANIPANIYLFKVTIETLKKKVRYVQSSQ